MNGFASIVNGLRHDAIRLAGDVYVIKADMLSPMPVMSVTSGRNEEECDTLLRRHAVKVLCHVCCGNNTFVCRARRQMLSLFGDISRLADIGGYQSILLLAHLSRYQ